MASTPGMLFGRSASVAGSVCASFRHGIWMMSFLHDTSFSITPSQVMVRARS